MPFAEIKAGGATPVLHEFWNRGDVARGGELYHTVGCVACHDPDTDYETAESKPSAIDELLEQLDPDQIAELGLASEARRVESVPHGDLSEKYTRRSLTMMLLNPAKSRPSARMPSLRLSPDEAADIAAYLLREQESATVIAANQDDDQAVIDAGKKMFVGLRCNACHEAAGIADAKTATPMAQLNLDSENSCIAKPRGSMARYVLDATQQDAIRNALRNDVSKARTAESEVHFRMLQMNCYGCHRRDGLGGVGRYRKPYFETFGNVDLGDEGRLPPPLSGVGNKLSTKALKAVFHPKTAPHRPYMTIRMPTYSVEATDSLVKQLPRADQAAESPTGKTIGQGEDLAEAGRELINTGCVGCHSFGGESLPGVVGIDLHGITTRVQPNWFKQFVLDPGKLKKRTRMPTFFPDGKSNRGDVLEGDVDKQVAAIWHYLHDLDRQPLPEKIAEARSANYELVPVDSPIVLRTFMQDAGTHAIAVGFPQGVHYAFDAENVLLSELWKGRFIDARGTWFERFAPPAEPLESRSLSLSKKPVVQIKSGDRPAFLGYRLDKNQIPTMLYAIGPCRIEDRIEASGADSVKRTLSLRAERPIDGLEIVLHEGSKLTPAGEASYADQRGLKVTLLERSSSSFQNELLQSEGTDQWVVHLDVDEPVSIQWEYRW